MAPQIPITLVIMVAYLLLLFGIAYYADRRRAQGRSIVQNPIVYALSLAVYASGWTYFGNNERITNLGFGYLTIYIGPTLIMLIGWFVIGKIIQISKQQGLTTVSDFMSARYGGSYGVGAFVAFFTLITIIPYYALQIVAVSTAVKVLDAHFGVSGVPESLIVSIILGIFAILFGARTLDPSERHEGLVAAVAFESIVKLTAFLAVGFFVTYGLFNGYGDIFAQTAATEEGRQLLTLASPTTAGFLQWSTFILIAMMAIIFLPRQFHVTVVENSDLNHLKTAMWAFPLYLFLILFFVPAIGFGGRLLLPLEPARTYIVLLPLEAGQTALAVYAFIGGLSASTAMVAVSSVAVATMVLNEIISPILVRREVGEQLPTILLNIKRVIIFALVLAGFAYAETVGTVVTLVNMGIISFIGITQFAPAALGGLYWRGGNKWGALAGLGAGFIMWAYTLFIPSFVESGILPITLLTEGPFGIALLRPTALFGLEGVDIWSHALFWSLIPNIILYVFVSLLSTPTEAEESMAEAFVRPPVGPSFAVPRELVYGNTIEEMETNVARYIGADRARKVVDRYLSRIGATRGAITSEEIEGLRDRLGRALTSALGPSAVRQIIEIPSVSPAVEKVEVTRPKFKIEPGNLYVASQEENAFEVFVDQVTHGVQGLAITWRHPREVREKYGLREVPILWVTKEKESSELTVDPRDLDPLFTAINSYAEVSETSVIFIERFDRLIAENSDPEARIRLIAFARGLTTKNGLRKSRILLSVDPTSLIAAPGDLFLTQNFFFHIHPLEVFLLEEVITQVIRTMEISLDIVESGLSYAREADERLMQIRIQRGKAVVNPEMQFTRMDYLHLVRAFVRGLQHVSPNLNVKAIYEIVADLSNISPHELALPHGAIYLVEEEGFDRGISIFRDMAQKGVCALYLSRTNPRIIRDEYGLFNVPLLWLTLSPCEMEGIRHEPGQPVSECLWAYITATRGPGCINPTNIPRLSSFIEKFVDQTPNGVIYLDGLEYLISQNDFPTVMRLIQSLDDHLMVSNTRLILSIDPLTLDTKELHLLRSEVKIVGG